jgi:hypothetical protein
MSAICERCGRDMLATDGCDEHQVCGKPAIVLGEEKRFGKIKAFPMCGDCGCSAGAYHHLHCDWEECPSCGSQLLGCDCE